MDIRTSVEDAFLRLGLTPRDGQVDTCVEIVEAFASGKRYVIVDAPTGSGKSVIGSVISLVASPQGSSVIVTATNALLKQYEDDFSDTELFSFIRGANQYPCELRDRMFKKTGFNAEMCYKKSKFYWQKGEEDPAVMEAPECDRCAFAISRKGKYNKPISVTNYSYFILDRLFIKTKTEIDAYDRPLYVFDEAHLINEMFVEHCSIYFSRSRGHDYLSDVDYLCGPESKMRDAYEGVFEIINENIERSTIGRKNVDKFLEMLSKFYKKMQEIIENKKNWSKAEDGYDYLTSLERKYHGLFCKIDDYFKYRYDIIVECTQAGELSVKPIFVKKCFKNIEAGMNLFMSATISEEVLVETLALDPELVATIKVPYSFEVDDKRVFISGSVKLNFETLKFDATYSEIAEQISIIAQAHEGENGIVVCTSFDMTERLAKEIDVPHEVIAHARGNSVAPLVDRMFTGLGKLLLSPSLFEGVDLPGDASSFQIIVKAPFYSIGDKRMRTIMMKHRKIYNAMTTEKLIQALGRSTRFSGDKSTHYLLDSNLVRVFNSKHNRWKDQFIVQGVRKQRRTRCRASERS